MARADPMLAALNDPRLGPFLTAREEAVRRMELERVVKTVAQPVIARVLRQCRRGIAAAGQSDLEDVEAAVLLRVLQKLESARVSEDEAVLELDNYVARLTFHAVADLRRRSAPEWARLKRRLRYVAAMDARLATWDVPSGTLCGLAEWRDRVDALETMPLDRAAAPPALRDPARPGDAMHGLLFLAKAPLALDTITEIFADWWQVEPAPASVSDEVVDPSHGPLAEYETREQLQIVWEEIRALPPHQRAALLLNLRDGIGLNAVVLFPLTGVAAFDEIAAAMEMSAEGLAEVWPRLPLADLEIAKTLGLERQQVINLRKAARARLERRIALRQKGRAR